MGEPKKGREGRGADEDRGTHSHTHIRTHSHALGLSGYRWAAKCSNASTVLDCMRWYARKQASTNPLRTVFTVESNSTATPLGFHDSQNRSA